MALETLPAAGLSSQEEQLKKHFEESLKLAEAGLAAVKHRSMSDNRMFVTFPNAPDKLPWMRALAMEDILTANNILNTCVSIPRIETSHSTDLIAGRHRRGR